MTRQLKEITVYTQGDSTRISTWSNVPFLLTETLLKKGIRVNRVNIGANRYLGILYNKLFTGVLGWFYPNHRYTYERTRLNFWLTKRRIRKAVRAYPSTGCHLFLTYGHVAEDPHAPSVLLCDWSYEVLICDRLARKPYPFEQNYINRETAAIEQADLVISLFPKCTEWMRRRSHNPSIYYLGGNVVNAVRALPGDPSGLVRQKFTSSRLLFIGNKKYLEGAKALLLAYRQLKKEIPGLELTFIGLSASDLGRLPQGVEALGYLRKEVPAEQELYYRRLMEARLFVNPTRDWGGYSSTIEAMYYYTPVVVTPYADFVEEFGREIGFGQYTTGDPANVAGKIRTCLAWEESIYKLKSNQAHEKVADYTWPAYVDKLLRKIEALPAGDCRGEGSCEPTGQAAESCLPNSGK